MLVARGRIENRQAIVKIGFQPFQPEAFEVLPVARAVEFPVHEYRALIDTGAQRTCLCRSVIGAEGLKRHAKRAIQNVREVQLHYLYWTHIGFFCERLLNAQERSGERTYYAMTQPIEVIDIADNYNFEAIIGMDILCTMDLQIDRSGTFALTVG